MKKNYKKAIYLILFILAFIITALIIPFVHDFIFDKYNISNYEEKEGIVSDVTIKKENEKKCENIIIDNYNIFVKCSDEQQYKIGDKTKYYIYKGKGYHTKEQMKSASTVGKIIDYGMIVTYIIMFFLLIYNEKRISDYIDEMAGNKEKS